MPRLLPLGALLLAACQSAPPERPEALPRAPLEVLQRFAFDEADEPLIAPIHVIGRSAEADAEGVDAPLAAIELNDVLRSVERHFPLLLAAEDELAVAEGRLLRSQGAFDTTLGTDGFLRTEGFRRSERFDVGFKQPTPLWGATFEGGYRLGLGEFDFYEEAAQTDDGGEFRFGVTLPLLQGRAVDSRRVGLWRARVERDAADPAILAARIDYAREATGAYWAWMSAGRLREIARRLLALAEDRADQFENAVEEGLLAAIVVTENQRLVVDRRTNLLEAERNLQQAAIRLSLYWRDAGGQPRVPSDELLPYDFPGVRSSEFLLVENDVDFALDHRPDLRAQALELQARQLDVDLAKNNVLPRFDVGVAAKQDVGPAASDPDDKGPFELEFQLLFELPLQLRRAQGGERVAEAELRRTRRETQFLRDRVQSEVQDARSALEQGWLSIAQARENVSLANELAELERFQFGEGQSDLLRVNLREQQTAVAGARLVGVLREYFEAVADYRAVLGVPPTVAGWAVGPIDPGD